MSLKPLMSLEPYNLKQSTQAIKFSDVSNKTNKTISDSRQPLISLQALLRKEYEEEKASYHEQLDAMGISRRVKRGLCWYPVEVGSSRFNSLAQTVVDIVKPVDDEIEHSFEYGRAVVFFTLTDDGSRTRIIDGVCQVSYVDGQRMVVVVPSSAFVAHLQQGEKVGVQLFFDETSYRAMFHAMDEAIKSKSGRIAHLRDIFAGLTSPATYSFPPQSFPWLNSSQEEALNNVLRAKDVAVVHGPPGTGKTTTMVEAIYETLRRETQVMVCAQSNMAVDWISEKLVDHGISVLRIGNPTRVNDKMLSFTYERRFESHPDYPELWSIRKAIQQLRSQPKRGENRHQKIARLKERGAEIEMRIHQSLFAEARVVACTLVGASNRLLVGQKFPTLFIDEAAQALEPACWIAIARAGRVVLAGDHKQLPPTIKSYEAMRGGLGQTLMERICIAQPQCVTMLRMQYRMNEAIMKFSSHWFYGDAMVASPSVRGRSILDYDTPIEWIDTHDMEATVEGLDYRETFVGATHGRVNRAEAELCIKVLCQYVEKIGIARFLSDNIDVGVISPYRMQIQYLRSLIKKDAALKRIRQRITVNTIDGFQGQERDIILISLVRSNDEGQIGFLSDLRRMNVAITRARMKLLIMGDATTLSHHQFYRELKTYVDSLKKDDEI